MPPRHLLARPSLSSTPVTQKFGFNTSLPLLKQSLIFVREHTLKPRILPDNLVDFFLPSPTVAVLAMVRIKERYLLVNILYPPNPSKTTTGNLPDLVFQHQPTVEKLTPQALLKGLRAEIAALYGDYGSGALEGNLLGTLVTHALEERHLLSSSQIPVPRYVYLYPQVLKGALPTAMVGPDIHGPRPCQRWEAVHLPRGARQRHHPQGRGRSNPPGKTTYPRRKGAGGQFKRLLVHHKCSRARSNHGGRHSGIQRRHGRGGRLKGVSLFIFSSLPGHRCPTAPTYRQSLGPSLRN